MPFIRKYKLSLMVVLIALSCSFVIYYPPSKPNLFLIGDSTVRNGSLGNGGGGLWGWGSYLHNLFDTTKISISNKALGGTSSRSYESTGLWQKVLSDLKPGDFVMIQFGHNDNGRASLEGNGDDTAHVINRRTKETVVLHSFGWNLRRYIRETKAKGAIPIVCSLVPRNRWYNGKVKRDDESHALWAKEAAAQEGVLFIDLNSLIADHYDELGEEKVLGTYFTAKDAIHTIEDGAKMNASLVVEGIKNLKNNPLKDYILKNQENMKSWKSLPSKDPRL